eukprot:s432_g29.t1
MGRLGSRGRRCRGRRCHRTHGPARQAFQLGEWGGGWSRSLVGWRLPDRFGEHACGDWRVRLRFGTQLRQGHLRGLRGQRGRNGENIRRERGGLGHGRSRVVRIRRRVGDRAPVCRRHCSRLWRGCRCHDAPSGQDHPCGRHDIGHRLHRESVKAQEDLLLKSCLKRYQSAAQCEPGRRLQTAPVDHSGEPEEVYSAEGHLKRGCHARQKLPVDWSRLTILRKDSFQLLNDGGQSLDTGPKPCIARCGLKSLAQLADESLDFRQKPVVHCNDVLSLNTNVVVGRTNLHRFFHACVPISNDGVVSLKELLECFVLIVYSLTTHELTNVEQSGKIPPRYHRIQHNH